MSLEEGSYGLILCGTCTGMASFRKSPTSDTSRHVRVRRIRFTPVTSTAPMQSSEGGRAGTTVPVLRARCRLLQLPDIGSHGNCLHAHMI